MAEFEIIQDYRDNDTYREMLFEFIKSVYPWADFRSWFERGWWADEYCPYSIVEDCKIISNVSVSAMKVVLNGRTINAAQFGTVGTIEEGRGRGLSRKLMEHAMAQYDDRVDLMFLFANDDVVEFYPKFGFREIDEHLFVQKSRIPKGTGTARRLSLESSDDVKLIEGLLAGRKPLTKRFGAEDYAFITTWHLLNLFPKSIYWVEEAGAVVIATFKDGVAKVWDVISRSNVDIDSLLSSVLPSEDVKEVIFQFPPDQIGFTCDEVVIDPESHLFIRTELAFPSEPIKFPTTAQT